MSGLKISSREEMLNKINDFERRVNLLELEEANRRGITLEVYYQNIVYGSSGKCNKTKAVHTPIIPEDKLSQDCKDGKHCFCVRDNPYNEKVLCCWCERPDAFYNADGDQDE